MDFENFGMNNLLEMDIKRASKMQMAHQDDDAWEEMYTKLVIFKDTHGHVNVPPNYTEADNLAPWLSLQRMLWRVRYVPISFMITTDNTIDRTTESRSPTKA